MHLRNACSALTIAAAVALQTAPARADEARVAVDWSRALTDVQAWVFRNSERSEGVSGEATRKTSPELGTAWFGVAPSVSIVARDWGRSFSFSGRLSPEEAMRLSRSSRMVVSRMRLNGGRVVPFAQLGLGEWRVDGDVVALPSNTELAAQFGGGLELHLLPGWEVAWESHATVIYREIREPQNLPATKLFGTMLASRFDF